MLTGGVVGTGDLLERSAQLSALGECLEFVVKHSRGRLVLVRGEAGIGKTAVVRRFCGEQRPSSLVCMTAPA